jgi:hypothetical protein
MAYLLDMLGLPDLPIYALQRIANDRWAIRSPDADPRLPAVSVVTVIDIQSARKWRPKTCAVKGHCERTEPQIRYLVRSIDE